MVLKRQFNLSKKPLIGMVHLSSFVNDMGSSLKINELSMQALQDARDLETAGFNAILIENYFNTPFSKNRLDDYNLLIMSSFVQKIVSELKIPFGINILRNCCVQALILATFHQASFIRCNVWEGVYVTDQGIIEGIANEAIRKKREMNSDVKILADVHVKHASPLGKFSMEDAAKNALQRGNADAIIVSGKETGKVISISKLKEFVNKTGIKPILGSGLSIENLDGILPLISGAIVGSSIKKDDISSPVDLRKAKALVAAWKKVGQ
jgi:membrane complex biogenesis BtpA family protein